MIVDFLNESPLPFKRFDRDPKQSNRGMIHLINLMGDNVTYLETGIYLGHSICGIVQQCKNITTAYGIDFYQPYTDYFELQPTFYSKEKVDRDYKIAINNILSSGNHKKIKLLKLSTAEASDYFENETIDFLFLDNYGNGEEVEEELERWYPKVRINGYFSGHDWPYEGVKNNVLKFREKYNITSTLSVFGAEWVWRK